MLIIYSEHITNRLQFIVTTLFGDDVRITNDIGTFNNFEGNKINYSTNSTIDANLSIKPVQLLFETEISSQQIDCFEWNHLKVFYKTEGSIPFDVLAASFYLLSRYEEYYNNYKKDEFGNYHHENSLAWKENFLNVPIIHLWLKEIEKAFGISSRKNQFTITPTYDIDVAFAYKYHSKYVQLGGLIKDLILQRGNFNERLQVMMGYKKDPYNIFSWLDELHEKYKLQPIYFFLLAKNRSKLDKNSLPHKKEFQHIIKLISKKYKIGIHPSYSSNFNKDVLKNELKTLETLVDHTITKSRQHYLQLQFPSTYKTLIEQGIEEDYTMGYGTCNGFRASYCYPYYWYDLQKESATSLLLHPLCYMDANSIFEQQLNAEQALKEIKFYYDQVKSVDGNFIFIMHNHFLAEQQQWEDWRKIYTEFLQFISVSSSI
jgi:hypothetical protein